MLVLTRKVGEKIRIGDDIVLTVVRIQNDKVRIGIEAPPEVTVHREEVYQRAAALVAENAPPVRKEASGLARRLALRG